MNSLKISMPLIVMLALIGAGLGVLEPRDANAAKPGQVVVARAVSPHLAKVEGTAQGRPASPATEVGELLVDANVKGAKISVDGRSDPSWLTPYTIPDLPAGTHDIVVSMDGYVTYQQRVTIEGGQTTSVLVNLSLARAEFTIVTVPPGVEVLIDGKSYGLSPVHITLDPGNHTYTVKPPGVAPYENTFSIKSGEIVSKRLILGNATGTGTVEVHSTPAGATVKADGAAVGGPTPTSFRLPVGSHLLTISLSGYQPTQQPVTVSANEPTPVNVTLAASAPAAAPAPVPPGSPPAPAADKRNAEISIETTPAGIEVLIDGKSYGPSPVRATLPPGDHTYTLKPPGMAPFQKTFTVKSGEIVVKKLTLAAPAEAHPSTSAPNRQP